MSSPLARHTAAGVVSVHPEAWVTAESDVQSAITEKRAAILKMPEATARAGSNT